jgi:uncharacterized protein
MIKRTCWWLVICIVSLSAACTSPAPVVMTEAQVLEYAETFMDLMSAEEYDQARTYFDPNLSQALTREIMEGNWQRLIRQHGVFLQLQDTRIEEYSDYYIAYVTCLFQKQVVEAKIVLNQKTQITAIFFMPANILPDVAEREFKEFAVTLKNGEFTLPGIVTLPSEGSNFPGIVLVHNSIAKDRDGTVGPNKIFRDLAWELAAQGIATLRYDKRALVYPEYFRGNFEYTAYEETISDAVQAVEFLRSFDNIDHSQVFLLGHGLGGTLGSYIASTDLEMRGLILMAALARPLEEALLDQYEYVYNITESLSKEEESVLENVRKEIDTLRGVFRGVRAKPKTLVLGSPISFWLDINSLNPESYLQTDKNMPVLVLQGGRDYQVTEADYVIWRELLAGRPAEFFLYEDLNHLFMPGEGIITPAEYLIPSNVAQSVVDDITAWVKSVGHKEG